MNKPSFLIHRDSLDVLDELTHEQGGRLFKAIRDFHNSENIELDTDLRIAFVPFKNQFKRDIQKYEKTVERNRINGQKGGRPPKNPTEPNKPSGLNGNPTKAKKADSDNDSDNYSDTKEISQPEQSSLTRKNPATPYQKIFDSYTDRLNGNSDYNLVEVASLTKKRKTRITELWVLVNRDMNKIDSYFVWLYSNRENHTWLFGKNDRGWKGDIEYVCREETFTKAKEGRIGNWANHNE
jgi:hypothetical protein